MRDIEKECYDQTGLDLRKSMDWVLYTFAWTVYLMSVFAFVYSVVLRMYGLLEISIYGMIITGALWVWDDLRIGIVMYLIGWSNKRDVG